MLTLCMLTFEVKPQLHKHCESKYKVAVPTDLQLFLNVSLEGSTPCQKFISHFEEKQIEVIFISFKSNSSPTVTSRG